MRKSSSTVGSLAALLLGASFASACGSPPVAHVGDGAKGHPVPREAAPTASASAPAPAPEPEPASAPEPPAESAPVEPTESPAFAQALAALQPPGTEQARQDLLSAPTNSEAYARAALAYAGTEAPAMTLIWGMSYQAMGGGASNDAVAQAFAKVLTARILAKPDEHQQATFNLRLAPGQMPVRRGADGSVRAPLAHTFEALFGRAVTGFRPPWTIEQFYDVLSTWTGIVAAHGTALDEQVELDGWLVSTAKAGHLEAFCYQLLGAAFPAELKAYKAHDAAALKSYRNFVKVAPLRPTHAPMPDELVRIE